MANDSVLGRIDKDNEDLDFQFREGEWERQEKEGKCIGCGGRATRTNNTLCQNCWQEAEGNNE